MIAQEFTEKNLRRHPQKKILLNVHPSECHILGEPSPSPLRRFVEGFEKEYVNSFWDNAVLQPSPYNKNLPYAFCCSAAGHSMFSIESVLAEFPEFSERPAKFTRIAEAVGHARLAALLTAWRPTCISGALLRLNANGRMRFPAFSLIEWLEKHKHFAEFAARVMEAALSNSPHKRYALSFAIAMRSSGWLLLPTGVIQKWGFVVKGINSSENIWVEHPTHYLSPSLRGLITTLEGDLTGAADTITAAASSKARYAVLCSSLSTTKELTWKFAEKILFSSSKEKRQGANTVCYSIIRTNWRALCERNGPVAAAGDHRPDFRNSILLRCPNDECLAPWIDAFVDECDRFRSGNYEPLYQAFGLFLTWLHSLETIPPPLGIERSQINQADPNANTFRNFLKGSSIQLPKNRNKVLHKLSRFFDRLASEEEIAGRKFHNPIRLRDDVFSIPRSQKVLGTHRKRLAGWIMGDLKKLIVVQNSSGGFEWAPSLKEISVTHLIPAGASEAVFCPIRPAIVYLMLEYPLRSHQVRWLDSGELDRLTFDFDKREFQVNPSFDGSRYNYGVLQGGNDILAHGDEEAAINFQVAINKVLLGDRLTSNFTIPYVSPETLWVIKQVLDWQKHYGAPPDRVKEADEPVKSHNRNQNMRDFFPDICPLFRYPGQRGYFPPTSTQIAYFWGELCHQFDVQHGTALDASSGQYVSKPGVPILACQYRHMWTATHDLHTLRVAGVSFLLDAGVPLGVVASIAGHHTVQMTLHYYRFEERELRLRLSQAYAKLKSEKILGHVEDRLLEFQEYESWLKSSPAGFAALREARPIKSWSIGLSGICPGTSCTDGLPPELKAPYGSDVPGSKCGLCQFFVTGPPFLPGLVHEFNCLLFELERKANKQYELRMKADEAEDRGAHREHITFRGEAERLDRECMLDMRALVRIHELIEESLELLNKQPDPQNNPLAVMLQKDGNIRARIERVGPFSKLKELVEAGECFPSSRLTAPEDALLRLRDRLLFFLRQNGATCFLAGLPPDIAKARTIEFARLLEHFVPETDKREDLIAGKIALKDLPGVESAVLEHAARVEASLPGSSGQKELE